MKLLVRRFQIPKLAMVALLSIIAFESSTFAAESVAKSSAAKSADEKVFDTGWKRPEGKFNYSKANKIVVHFNSLADEQKLGKMLHSFQQMRSEIPKLDIKIVVHGEALRVFKEASKNEAYKKFIDDARIAGAQFLVCHNSLINMKTRVAELYSVTDADIVPAAIPEIVLLQKKGYSYIRYF